MAAITMTSSSPLILYLPTSPRRCLLLRRPLKVTRRPVAFPAANGSFNGSVCFPSALLFVFFWFIFALFFGGWVWESWRVQFGIFMCSWRGVFLRWLLFCRLVCVNCGKKDALFILRWCHWYGGPVDVGIHDFLCLNLEFKPDETMHSLCFLIVAVFWGWGRVPF